MPYLLTPRVIPPCHVVNDILRRGIVDAGMSGGCRWEPFQIDEAEWEHARTTLEANPEHYSYVEPAAWVSTYEDWHAWLFEHLYGVPAQEHRQLNEQDAELARQLDEALRAGDTERIGELHVQRADVGDKLATLLNEHLMNRRRRDG